MPRHAGQIGKTPDQETQRLNDKFSREPLHQSRSCPMSWPGSLCRWRHSGAVPIFACRWLPAPGLSRPLSRSPASERICEGGVRAAHASTDLGMDIVAITRPVRWITPGLRPFRRPRGRAGSGLRTAAGTPAARTRIAAPAGPMAAPGMRTPRTPPARSSGRTVKLVRSTGIRSPVTGATRATDYGAAGARRVRERPRPPHRLAMITTTNSTSPRPGRLAEQVRQP